MGYYLQIGDVILADGESDSAGYSLTGHPSFPEPDPDGYGSHRPAVRSFTVRCIGTTASAAHHKASLLRRECVRDNVLYFRHGDSGDVLSCRIRNAKCVEAEYAPGLRDAFGVTLGVTLETDPYWLGEWSAETSASASVTLPYGHFDVADPGGEVDALLTVRCVPTTSGTLLALGVKPEPGTGYDYVDDYSGSADANMVGGSGSAVVTASAAYAAVGTAPDIDTNDNRGSHLLLARADCSATSFATTYLKGRSTVTGNLIATSTSASGQAVAFSASALAVYELGNVDVPSGAVPSGEYGSGWSTEAAQITQADDSGTMTITAPVWVYGAPYIFNISQTFGGVAGRITAFEYVVDATMSGLTSVDYTFSASGQTQTGTATMASGTNKIDLSPYIESTGTSSGYFTLSARTTASADQLGLAMASGDVYSSGTLSVISGTATTIGRDLVFKVYGQTPVGFNTTTPVLTAQAEASAGVQVDYVQRIPTDYAAVVYRDTGVMGLYYDADTDTPYDADSDGIGPAMYDKTEIRAPLRAKPGVTNRVVVAIGQGDETPAGVSTLTYKTRPRFLTATG